MYMKDEKIVEIDDYRLELENRIRNLLWTISGDYTLNMKVDVSLYLRSKAIALYDGIKQGALAKYYDRNLLGLYLVKKVFCQAGEGELTAVAQLCVEKQSGTKSVRNVRESGRCRRKHSRISWIRSLNRCPHTEIFSVA